MEIGKLEVWNGPSRPPYRDTIVQHRACHVYNVPGVYPIILCMYSPLALQ